MEVKLRIPAIPATSSGLIPASHSGAIRPPVAFDLTLGDVTMS